MISNKTSKVTRRCLTSSRTNSARELCLDIFRATNHRTRISKITFRSRLTKDMLSSLTRLISTRPTSISLRASSHCFVNMKLWWVWTNAASPKWSLILLILQLLNQVKGFKNTSNRIKARPTIANKRFCKTSYPKTRAPFHSVKALQELANLTPF